MAEVIETLPGPATSTLPSETNSGEQDPHPRLADYKARSIRCSQEERRFNLLLEQKERRGDSFNASRGIIAAISSNDDVADEEMEWNKIEEAKKACGFSDKLMMSEWLIEVPSNLADSWYMVPCPKGRRTLIITARGSTRSYNKYGCFTASFPSVLPGGHGRGPSSHGSTILDCIWHAQSKTYYILDVLAWNNQPLLDCETEFRFFWLQSKIRETEGISERSDENQYPFILLPHYPCESETLTTIMAMHPPFADETVILDGLLFYHSQCHYHCGTTPLVGWLKPFMLPDILNIPVAQEYMAMKPEGYKNLIEHAEQQIQALKSKKWYKVKKKKKKPSTKQESMEITVSEEELDSHDQS
ncbi:snurportin-1 [Anabrus simplex]|uniref:snurportin-1 n=1 Tax=Anabrus simplex TaxID=316456 RepID=UPI0034DD1D3B